MPGLTFNQGWPTNGITVTFLNIVDNLILSHGITTKSWKRDSRIPIIDQD
jgi:hypothetical protein